MKKEDGREEEKEEGEEGTERINIRVIPIHALLRNPSFYKS
jgi:hypothetical protein